MLLPDKQYYLQALRTRFDERPPRTLKELQDFRGQLLESFIPHCCYGNTLYFELDPLIFLHTSKSSLGCSPLTKLCIHVAKLGKTSEFQRNWQFGAMPNTGDSHQIFPFVTLKDFDHDCLPLIITSLLEGDACPYITKFLRILDSAYPQPMLDTPMPNIEPLVLRPSTLYNFERSGEVAYSLWYAQRGNFVHSPRYFDHNGIIFYSMMDLVRIYGDFTSCDEWACMQVCQQLVQNQTMMNFLIASGAIFILNSGSGESYLETQFILLPNFLSTVLPHIHSEFSDEIMRIRDRSGSAVMQNDMEEASSDMLGVKESVRKAIASQQLYIPPKKTMSPVDFDSMDRIYEDFIAIVEHREIVAYYFKDGRGIEFKVYDLNVLTELVVGKPHTPSEHKNKWRCKWNRNELKEKNIVRKIGERWMIEAHHFLLWCLDSTRFNAELLEYIKPIQARLEKVEAQRSQYPAIEMTETAWHNSIISTATTDTSLSYSDEEAMTRVRQWEYATRFLQVRAHQQGYHRRSYGKHNNLYEARHLAKIAGPYVRVDNANEAVMIILSDLAILETESHSKGLVSFEASENGPQRHFVTIDYFQHHIWHRLGRGNDRYDKSCKLAHSFREGAFNTDSRVKSGSAQVMEETVQNAMRLQRFANPEEHESRQERLDELESQAAPMLASNPAQGVKTVVVPVSTQESMNFMNEFSADMEWRKYELQTKEAAETARRKLTLDKEERIQMATIETQTELARAELEKQRKLTLKETEMTNREKERTKQVEFREITRQTSIRESTRLAIENGKMEIERLRIDATTPIQKGPRAIDPKSPVIKGRQQSSQKPSPPAKRGEIQKTAGGKLISRGVGRPKKMVFH